MHHKRFRPTILNTLLLDTLVLLAFAAALIWPLFRIEYLANWQSIESIFIADARFLADHWPFPAWQPDWYCGNRFDYIYPPALRYGTAGLSLLGDISTARAYHIFVGFFYALGGASVYVFARIASGSRMWSFLSAILFNLTSPFLLFSTHFRTDYANNGYMPVRLGALVLYGEGPHICAFALIPFAMAAAWKGMKDGSVYMLALAGAISAAVVALNLYGAVALAMFFGVVLWSLWLTHQDNRMIARLAVVGAVSYVLVASWFTPSFVRLTLRNMKLVSDPGNRWSIWLALAVAVLFAAATWKWARRRPDRAWPVFVLGNLAMWSLQILGNEFLGFRVLGEPQRQVPEFDWAFYLGVCLLLGWVWKRHWAGKALAAAGVLLVAWLTSGFVRNAWSIYVEDPNPKERIEYRITKWMHDNMPDARSMATGTLRFWYNAWFDLPQMAGGSDQGLINMAVVHGHNYLSGAGDKALITAWGQALGVDVLIAHEDPSQEIYRDFHNVPFLKANFEQIHESGEGDYVFRIPRRLRDRVRVVSADVMERFPRNDGEHGAETIMEYAREVEKEPAAEASLVRVSPDAMQITAATGAGELVLVQESYDPGWTAYRGGERLLVTKDAMGFMLIDSGAGRHEIRLVFEPPLEMRAGRWIQTAGQLGLLLFFILPILGRFRGAR